MRLLLCCFILCMCCINAYSEELKIIQKVELSFFADQDNFKIEDRKKLVSFLKEHKLGDIYEFEILSFSDPLNIGFDVHRLKNLQALFRQYDINIEKAISAKVRFIASDKQKIVVVRKHIEIR